MADTSTRPPFDPQVRAVLDSLGALVPVSITPEMIPAMRANALGYVPIDDLLRGTGIRYRDVTVPGYRGDDILLSVFEREGRTVASPGVFHTHGGGMVIGDRFYGIPQLLPIVEAHDAVIVTVEYRLAPEHPDPYLVEDCYAGLRWAADHAGELGIDPERLLIAGASAGGGLAAGTALLARDRGGPALAGQLLMCPMLDDRDATASTAQIDGVGVWDRGSNVTGWSALLGDRRGTEDVSIYAAPARATDLTGLPPTYIDCGSAEVFRDEDVAYASALWAAGGRAELHVWEGGYHGFEEIAPDAEVSRASVAARASWVARTLRRA